MTNYELQIYWQFINFLNSFSLKFLKSFVLFYSGIEFIVMFNNVYNSDWHVSRICIFIARLLPVYTHLVTCIMYHYIIHLKSSPLPRHAHNLGTRTCTFFLLYDWKSSTCSQIVLTLLITIVANPSMSW